MKRGRWADQPELLRKRSRLNVIKASTLRELGMKDSTIYRRCRPDGPWRRLLPGIILLQSSPPTADQRAVAALLYCGPLSQITGAEACRRHGLRLPKLGDDRLHLLNPHETKVGSSGFVLIERTARLPEPVVREGIPLTPLTRAVLDLTRRIPEVEPVMQLVIEAIQRGHCVPEAMSKELEIGGRRGSAIPRQVLSRITDLRSVAESHGRDLSMRMKVPPSDFNVDVYDANGRYIGRPDQWWDHIALAHEIDSFDFHFWKDDYARTVQRDTRYAAAGIIVVRTLPSRILQEPDEVLAELEAAYQAALARPRPTVRAIRRAA
ncbi:hypothetical protein [Fodinicola acaciae]|uniref:hypothetical protein n=1 Tax=Fodinicola acaciae TaxID=2681555 RepID=UPI001C9E8159|nr:hypothetical protein [Fodinicola acaciae]